MNRWWWSAGVAVAVLSGATALALLLLPLVLLLLMVLFDSATHGLMALLGLVATWLQVLLPPGGGLPAYGAIALDPLPAAARAALRSAPCLLGLILIFLSPRPVSPRPVSTRPISTRPGTRWWCITVLWIIAAAGGGRLVAGALLPGLMATLVLAIRSAAPQDR